MIKNINCNMVLHCCKHGIEKHILIWVKNSVISRNKIWKKTQSREWMKQTFYLLQTEMQNSSISKCIQYTVSDYIS